MRRSQLPERRAPAARRARRTEETSPGGARTGRRPHGESRARSTPRVAAAVFALAQICVDTGQPDQAIKWLEHPKFGPLTLVKRQPHPALAPVVCHRGLQAGSAGLHRGEPPATGQGRSRRWTHWKSWCREPATPRAAENLTAIYISLGRELEQHLQDLRKSGKTKELDQVSKAFEVFLDRVTKRDAGNSFASLNWVGRDVFQPGRRPRRRRRPRFRRSPRPISRRPPRPTSGMLAMAEKDPKFKDQPDSLLGVRAAAGRLLPPRRATSTTRSRLSLRRAQGKADAAGGPSAGRRDLPVARRGRFEGLCQAIRRRLRRPRRQEHDLGLGQAFEDDHEQREVYRDVPPGPAQHGRGPLSLCPGARGRPEAGQVLAAPSRICGSLTSCARSWAERKRPRATTGCSNKSRHALGGRPKAACRNFGKRHDAADATTAASP